MNFVYLSIYFYFVIKRERVSTHVNVLLIFSSFTPSMLKRHKNVIKELVARDYNHPSVIMWSLANEPVTKDYNAGLYFK